MAMLSRQHHLLVSLVSLDYVITVPPSLQQLALMSWER